MEVYFLSMYPFDGNSALYWKILPNACCMKSCEKYGLLYGLSFVQSIVFVIPEAFV